MSLRHAHSARHVACTRCAGGRRTRSLIARTAAGLALGGGLVAGAAAPASASAPVTASVAPAAVTAATPGVIASASRYFGTPYVWGGTTPAGFDCSGFTQYVFRSQGVSLPRTSGEQQRATTRISAAEARAGDLVFFSSGGRVYHVGIYAGNGLMIDSPSAGGVVSERRLWTSNVTYGRV